MKKLYSNVVLLTLSLLVISGVFQTSVVNAAVGGAFDDFEFTTIKQDSVSFETRADTPPTDGTLHYLILREGQNLSDGSAAAGTNYPDFLDEADVVANAEKLNLEGFSELKFAEDLISGQSEIGSTIDGLIAGTDYTLHVVEREESAIPQEDRPEITEAIIKDIPYNESDQYLITANSSGSGFIVQNDEMGNKYFKDTNTTSDNTKLVLNTNTSAGDSQDNKITIEFDNTNATGEEWLLTIENDDVSIEHLPKADFIAAEDGVFHFSTDGFPAMNTQISGDDPGVTISGNSYVDPTWRYIRGVRSGQINGTLRARFEGDIEFVAGQRDAITLRDPDGSNHVDSVSVQGDELIVKYGPLEPETEYVLDIPDGTLAAQGNGSYNVDTDNIIFYTEQKARVMSTYFSPSLQRFDHERSPFRRGTEYAIPGLYGLNAAGVGVNQALVVQFENSVAELNPDKISVKTNPIQPDLDYEPVINEKDPSQLFINFDTSHPDRLLEYGTIYEVVIEPGAVKDEFGGSVYAENSKITADFKTADGFENVFLNQTAQDLNREILQNSSHNIAIDVPDVYIQELETIHYRDGLVPNEEVAPNLTNIDIDAHNSVETIEIVTDRGVRENITRGNNEKFSTIYAGLDADISDIKVTAFDQHGKVLERRSFRLQGAPGSEFVNNYVPEITNVFGTTLSLYELLSNPDLMQQILEQIPVSELNRIGVFYPYDL
ncbi:hypothetical protein [Salimicrobium halophilum]|uniref:SbsA Ig-like domain-containing protein n=1 Tax=Salimicrobium halophilum TaxID=86666 RepID=A0A1G8S132_9BACI|nr:hypothetical protein [Salimicrobium halophilum]SDJ22916.1 hypothetical protein SAMN04490247_1197 [Salimicrobium halophilum]